MFVVWYVLNVLIVIEAVLTLFKILKFRRFFFREVSRNVQPQRWPKVALLAPCKGADPELRQNVQSWFDLDYPDVKIFFIVDALNDPAAEILREFPNGVLMVAGKATNCGQKVHNLRYAVQQLPAEYEVLAFIDADCSVRTDWLRNLIAKLMTDSSNAATGYRWFTNNHSFGSVLRAAWNSSVLTLYAEDANENFAWGGSTAIFRNVFESSRVLDAWQGSISDDYSLTNAVKNSGHRVNFVPKALAFTNDAISLTDFVKWAFRQLLITRIYHPRLWIAAFAFHFAWVAWILCGLFFPIDFIRVFALIQVLQAVKADIRLKCVRLVHPAAGNRFAYWFLGPVVGLCNSILLIATIFTKKVFWANIEYEVIDPTRVLVKHR
jgi:ceramide glucosyltransferase